MRLGFVGFADCRLAAENLTSTTQRALDVHCRCGANYCFNCKEEAHRPVS